MEITTEDHNIKAGWIKVRFETKADIDEYNTPAFAEKIDDKQHEKEYTWAPHDDCGGAPEVRVIGADEGRPVVAIVDPLRGDVWEKATLPVTLAIWSYERTESRFEK